MSGGDPTELDVDGVSQWKTLLGKETKPPRTEFLVNSEFLVDASGINTTVHASSYVDGPWKLVWGLIYPGRSDFTGETGRTPGAKPYDWDAVLDSPTMETLLTASKLRKEGLNERARRLRSLATMPEDCRKDAPKQVGQHDKTPAMN